MLRIAIALFAIAAFYFVPSSVALSQEESAADLNVTMVEGVPDYRFAPVEVKVLKETVLHLGPKDQAASSALIPVGTTLSITGKRGGFCRYALGEMSVYVRCADLETPGIGWDEFVGAHPRQLSDCRDLTDDNARLICFDRLSNIPAADASTDAPPAPEVETSGVSNEDVTTVLRLMRFWDGHMESYLAYLDGCSLYAMSARTAMLPLAVQYRIDLAGLDLTQSGPIPANSLDPNYRFVAQAGFEIEVTSKKLNEGRVNATTKRSVTHRVAASEYDVQAFDAALRRLSAACASGAAGVSDAPVAIEAVQTLDVTVADFYRSNPAAAAEAFRQGVRMPFRPATATFDGMRVLRFTQSKPVRPENGDKRKTGWEGVLTGETAETRASGPLTVICAFPPGDPGARGGFSQVDAVLISAGDTTLTFDCRARNGETVIPIIVPQVERPVFPLESGLYVSNPSLCELNQVDLQDAGVSTLRIIRGESISFGYHLGCSVNGFATVGDVTHFRGTCQEAQDGMPLEWSFNILSRQRFSEVVSVFEGQPARTFTRCDDDSPLRLRWASWINRPDSPPQMDIDPSATETSEVALGLTAQDRSEIQRRLLLAGFDPNGVDGVFGPGSRGAISRWQASRSYAATGFIDQAQLAALKEQTEDAYAKWLSEAAKRRPAGNPNVWTLPDGRVRYRGRDGCWRERNDNRRGSIILGLTKFCNQRALGLR